MPGTVLIWGLILGFAAGPVLAGWSGLVPQAVPVFAVLLLAGHLIEKRGHWPAEAREWADAGVAMRLVLTLGVQLLYAGILFLAGLALARLTGALPLPFWAPFAPTLAALAVSAMWWLGRPAPGAAESAQMDAFLDEALDRLTAIEARVRAEAGATAPADDVLHDHTGTAGALVAALSVLPDEGATDAEIDTALADVLAAHPRADVGAVLLDIAGSSATERNLRAVARFATHPGHAADGTGHGDPAQAFELIAQAGLARALASWVAGAEMLLRAEPEAWRDLPAVARMAEIAAQLPADDEALADALLRLANRAEDLAHQSEETRE